ncbi:hypothetical protein ABG79_00302 [Caloramator mitchellensis]|uniref:SPOR domain-containing protein n=1 Tax=Caloramator mitchellensis TaxID=908809 RepID=A0A0R3K3Y5_CALMK|nr:hypothetical protein [Caloramator mitchellensis]KRQ88132.1 hypothetical protein ABG79_00302 [Caloramator mitchellensis]
MRYVRIHIHKNNKIRVIAIISVIFLVLLSSSYYIMNRINSDAINYKLTNEQKTNIKSNVNDSNNTTKINQVHKYNYYIVQLGYFKVKQNAEIFSKTLKMQGIRNAIIENNGYTVISLIENNKIYVTNEEKHLRNSKLSFIIKSVEFSTNNELLIEINNFISKQIDVLNNRINSEQLSIENKMLKIKKHNSQSIDKLLTDFKMSINEFDKNLSLKKYEECLNNLANEIYIVKELDGIISQLK